MPSKFLVFTVAAGSVFALAGCGTTGFGDVTSKVTAPLQFARSGVSLGERHLVAGR